MNTNIPVITSESEVQKYVGQVVTLKGTVLNSKIPTLLGVDIASDDPDLRGEQAIATGLLEQSEVKGEDVDPYSASRGAGTYYQLVNKETKRLVQVMKAE